MAITNLSELRAAIAAWLARESLLDRIDDFIAIAEARFNRRLRGLQALEVKDELVIKQETLPVPKLYKGHIKFTIRASSRPFLTYNAPQQFFDKYKGNNPGTPRDFTVVGGEFYFGPPPNGEYIGDIVYYERFAPLTPGNPTNRALDEHPDLYLYLSLVAAEGFLQNDDRLAFWKMQAEEIMEEIKRDDRSVKRSGSSVAARR